MKNYTINNKKGSIALIGVLIISAILIILTIGMSESNLSVMDQYLNNESSQNMYHIAEGCLEETILRIEGDTSFSGTTLGLGDFVCVSSVTGTTTKTISIELTYLDYTQNFSAQVSVTTSGQANNVLLLNWGKI
jgi:type II secretory pathway component PulK